MNKLSRNEVLSRARDLEGWLIQDDKLVKEYIFNDFKEAVEYVRSIQPVADSINHHPDICIHYNRVHVELTTHDAGGLTELDFKLASELDKLRHEKS
ncbi:MAG: 4a-hydroxytetrahydrobiopterin dehydratase [Thermocladium sp.]